MVLVAMPFFQLVIPVGKISGNVRLDSQPHVVAKLGVIALIKLLELMFRLKDMVIPGTSYRSAMLTT